MPDRLESVGAAFERPVIVVTGFMGAGKTTVGKALSGMLGLDFVDTDAEIASPRFSNNEAKLTSEIWRGRFVFLLKRDAAS
jgi:shikimate kinase